MASTETSAVSMRARVWATNSSSEPSRMGRGSTITVAPHSQVAWMAVTSGREVGPSRATRCAGPDAPALQADGHAPGVEVQLGPGHPDGGGRVGPDEGHPAVAGRTPWRCARAGSNRRVALPV